MAKKPEWTNKEAWDVYDLATGDKAMKREFDSKDRQLIADEMRKIAAAKTVKEAVEVIHWWYNGEEESLATVRDVRKAYKEWRKANG